MGATSQRQLPPLQALQGINTRRKDKGENGGEPPFSRELEDAWLSAGKGKVHRLALCLNDTLGHQLKPAVSAHPLPAMDTALEYPVLKQEG